MIKLSSLLKEVKKSKKVSFEEFLKDTVLSYPFKGSIQIKQTIYDKFYNKLK